MNLISRTGSNITWILLSDFVTKITTLLATIYLARILGVDNFGIFSLSVVVASVLWPVVDIGVSGYGVREIAKNPGKAKELINSLNSSRIISATFITFISILFLYLIDIPDIKFLSISLGLIYLAGYAICPDWLMRGLEDMKSVFLINATTSIFFISSILLLVHSPSELLQSSFLRAISFLFGSIAGIIILNKYKKVTFLPTLNLVNFISTLNKTRHFIFNRIISNLNLFVSFLVVSAFLSSHAVGLFSAPHRVYILIYGGISAIASAIYPVLSDVYENHNTEFKKYQSSLITFFLYTFAFGSFFCIVYSEEITVLLFGIEYLESSPSLAMMIFTSPVLIIKSIYTFSLSSSGHEKHIFKTVLYGMFAQLLMLSLTLVYFGIFGAAISLLIGEIVTTFLIAIKNREFVDSARFLDISRVTIILVTLFLYILLFIDVEKLKVVGIAILTFASLGIYINSRSSENIFFIFKK